MPALRRLLPSALLLLSLAPAGAEEVVSYVVVDGLRIEEPLAGREGDPARGAALFGDPGSGGCASCHTIGGSPLAPAPPLAMTLALVETRPQRPAAPEDVRDYPADYENTAPAPGAAPLPAARPAGEEASPGWTPPRIALHRGPPLDGIGDRMSAGELRLVMANPRLVRPASAMPAYYDVSVELGERNPSLRQPWLSAQQIEDLVAWLSSLRADGARDAADTGN